jgi:hypothetical protein
VINISEANPLEFCQVFDRENHAARTEVWRGWVQSTFCERSVLKYEVTLGSRIFFRNERQIVAIVNVYSIPWSYPSVSMAQPLPQVEFMPLSHKHLMR